MKLTQSKGQFKISHHYSITHNAFFHLVNVRNTSAGDRNHKKMPLVCAHYMGDGGKAWERGYLFLPNFLHKAKFTLMSAHPEVSFTWLMHPGEF